MANHLRRKDGKHEDHEEKEKRRPEERPQRCCKAGYNKPKLLEHAEPLDATIILLFLCARIGLWTAQ